MDKIIYFDICSVPIYLITLCTTLYRRMTKGRANKLYLATVMCAFGSVVLELLENIAYLGEPPYSAEQILCAKVVDYTYFVARNAIPVLYLFFVIAMTKTWYRIRAHRLKIMILLPYLALLLLLALNESNGFIFSISPEEGYLRGGYILLLYIVAFSYMFSGVIYLVINRKSLGAGEWFSLLSMYLMNYVSVGFQLLSPAYEVESFVTSLTLLFIVIYVQRPERQVDAETGLPSYSAFCDEMYKIRVAGGRDVQIVIVALRNAEEMRSYLKEEYLNYLLTIDEQIRQIAREEHIACDLYYEPPGSFYLILEDTAFNPVQAVQELRERIRKRAAGIVEMGAPLNPSIVTVCFPKEIDDLDELLRFGHNFARYTDYSRIFSRASAVTENRGYQIEAHIDEILNRAFSADRIRLRYQPVWSVSEQAFVAAEAVIALEDSVYGEIEPELLLHAAEERGLSVRLGRQIMEEVFAFAGSSTLRRLGYRCICVTLSFSQCMQMDLTDTVWRLRENYKVDPSRIAFAVRENSYGNTSDVFKENLKKLSAQGYRIVLDGFGRGYTNMQQMLAMPAGSVRLHPNLVHAAKLEGGRAVLQGIVDMMRNIPRDVIAQGADDAETAKMLCDMGCDLIQGHYYADPDDKDKLPARDSSAPENA